MKMMLSLLVLALAAIHSAEAEDTTTSFSCPADYEKDHNRFYPDPSDCNKFYFCGDKLHHWTCEDGRRFDPKLRFCRDATKVACPKNKTPETAISFPCPNGYKNDTNRFYRDTADCNRFYVCEDDSVKHWTCSDNERFDPVSRYCVPYFQIPCQTFLATGHEFTCPANYKNDTNRFYPDVTNCNRFYVCDDDSLKHWTCEGDQRFDPKNRYCAAADKVPCNQIVATGDKFTCPADYKKDTNRFYQDAEDCNRFYVCEDDSLQHWTCSGNERFDPKSRYCVAADKVPCNQVVPSGDKFTCPSGYKSDPNRFYQDIVDCNKFYVCEDDSVLHWTCSGNERFDPKSRYCVAADKVPCKQVVEVTSEGFTCPFGYQQDANRFYRDPADCHMFYVCEDNALKHWFCEDDQRFDPENRYCVDADKVPCINGKLPAPTAPTGTAINNNILPLDVPQPTKTHRTGIIRTATKKIPTAKPTDKVKTAKVKTAEVKPAEVKTPEVKPAEVKPAEVKPAEVKPAEVKTPKVKTPKVKTPKVKTPKVKTPKVKTPEVKTPEVKTPEVKTPEVKPAEVKPAEHFSCPEDWIEQLWNSYPYIGDCTRYYVCSGVGNEFEVYNCPKDYVFSRQSFICTPKMNTECIN